MALRSVYNYLLLQQLLYIDTQHSSDELSQYRFKYQLPIDEIVFPIDVNISVLALPDYSMTGFPFSSVKMHFVNQIFSVTIFKWKSFSQSVTLQLINLVIAILIGNTNVRCKCVFQISRWLITFLEVLLTFSNLKNSTRLLQVDYFYPCRLIAT